MLMVQYCIKFGLNLYLGKTSVKHCIFYVRRSMRLLFEQIFQYSYLLFTNFTQPETCAQQNWLNGPLRKKTTSQPSWKLAWFTSVEDLIQKQGSVNLLRNHLNTFFEKLLLLLLSSTPEFLSRINHF